MINRLLMVVVLLAGLGALAQPAQAAKPSTVAKLAGIADDTVRTDPMGDWLALWIEQLNDNYSLYILNINDGQKIGPIIETDQPGGLCWIPGYDRLLFSRGVRNEIFEINEVVYYTYEVATGETLKVDKRNDIMDTYTLDPLASDTGDIVFMMTIDKYDIPEAAGIKGVTILPQFHFYDPDTRLLTTVVPESANIGTDFDMTSDGRKLYWHLQDPETRDLFIVGWSFTENRYTTFITYSGTYNPADDLALFTMDSTSNMAATIAFSEIDPTLQMCVFRFVNPDNPTIIPVHMAQGNNVIYQDWRGRSGTLYAVVKNDQRGEYSIVEINPLSGDQTTLLTSQDEILAVEYNSAMDTYFYVVVDERNRESAIVRLKRD